MEETYALELRDISKRFGSEGNYAQNTVDTYYGEAMAVVRAGEAGSVKITVSDEERTYTCEIPVIVAK